MLDMFSGRRMADVLQFFITFSSVSNPPFLDVGFLTAVVLSSMKFAFEN
jgi:hypothetical protein